MQRHSRASSSSSTLGEISPLVGEFSSSGNMAKLTLCHCFLIQVQVRVPHSEDCNTFCPRICGQKGEGRWDHMLMCLLLDWHYLISWQLRGLSEWVSLWHITIPADMIWMAYQGYSNGLLRLCSSFSTVRGQTPCFWLYWSCSSVHLWNESIVP